LGSIPTKLATRLKISATEFTSNLSPTPRADEFVQLEIKGLYNVMSARQKQAKALGWVHIKKFIDNAGEGIRADRDHCAKLYSWFPGRRGSPAPTTPALAAPAREIARVAASTAPKIQTADWRYP
jgi:hypothetical protein